jgi:hypothetical protein
MQPTKHNSTAGNPVKDSAVCTNDRPIAVGAENHTNVGCAVSLAT